MTPSLELVEAWREMIERRNAWAVVIADLVAEGAVVHPDTWRDYRRACEAERLAYEAAYSHRRRAVQT